LSPSDSRFSSAFAQCAGRANRRASRNYATPAGDLIIRPFRLEDPCEDAMRHIATFCGQCNCGCPELYLDDAAAPERRIVITDDFGQRIQMSLEQLADLVADVRRGVLDDVLAAA
jgi:hypothetical protein